jgi:ankyrin repeat protein
LLTSPSYGNALTAAAYDGTLPIVTLLLDHAADPNSPHGWPLQIAAAAGHDPIVRLLLARGADINNMHTANPNFTQGTALQAAVEAGNTNMVALLLEHGADVNLGAGPLAPPIYAATEKAHSAITKLLVEHNVELNILGGEEQSTPLIGAAMYMHVSDLAVLVAAGANVDMADVDGDTPLIIAAVCGEPDSVEFLLKHGADVLPVSKMRGINALQAALENGDRRCLELMIGHVSELLRGASIAKKGTEAISTSGGEGEGQSDEEGQEAGEAEGEEEVIEEEEDGQEDEEEEEHESSQEDEEESED